MIIVAGFLVRASEQYRYIVDGDNGVLRRFDGIGAISGGGVSVLNYGQDYSPSSSANKGIHATIRREVSLRIRNIVPEHIGKGDNWVIRNSVHIVY